MQKLVGILTLLIALPFGANAGGRVEAVRTAVENQCRTKIPEENLLDAVIQAFDCTPETEITIQNCKIKCLKESRGTVVGK